MRFPLVFLLSIFVIIIGVIITDNLVNAQQASPVCDIGIVDRRIATFESDFILVEICPINTILTYSEWHGSELFVTRAASALEIFQYNQKIANSIIDISSESLRGNLESGSGWIETLKRWESQGLNAHENWDSLSPTEKDQIQKLLVFRVSKIMGGLADLLTVQQVTR